MTMLARPTPSSAWERSLTGARALLQAGDYTTARDELERVERDVVRDPAALLAISECWTHLGRHANAERACRAAVEIAPGDQRALYALASTLVATGEVEEAEQLYDAVIARAPSDWDAWANRSTLRRASPEHNHLEALCSALAGCSGDPHARVALGYALARELEDLGRHSESFAALADAAAARRARLTYRVEQDVETMSCIAAAFDRRLLSATASTASAPAPVFVLGLPRSGTTLVDRILSSHPDVVSLGELPDFALSVMATAGGASDKAELIKRSVSMDHAALGTEYRRRLAGHASGGRFVIDKTPLNFLYVGLIALALPEARIVHVRRGAMDGCYAMLKSLFRMGYPFSYSLDDLAAYRIAYERLMAHWRAVLPGRMIEVDYEVLVRDQAAESRRLVEAVGLAWDPVCLRFEANRAPVATASAIQVRQPIHARSVGLWRRYREQLAPLAEALARAGIPLEHEAVA